MLSAFQSVALLWMAVFPRGYKLSKRAGHLKFLHFISVVICVVVPIITSLLQLEEGFETVGVPPLVCLGKNKDYVYYMISLPMSIIAVIPAATVIIAGWTLLTVSQISHDLFTFCSELLKLLFIIVSIINVISLICGTFIP